jgi:hypothetical protein
MKWTWARRAFHGAGLGAALAVAGCDGPVQTNIDGDLAAPIFHFSTPFNQNPCISSISIVDGRHNAVWQLDRVKCIKLDKAKYGQPPVGFNELTRAQRLSENAQYSIALTGYGVDTAGGFCHFAWREGHWVEWTSPGDTCG